jgi:hypothetical protein
VSVSKYSRNSARGCAFSICPRHCDIKAAGLLIPEFQLPNQRNTGALDRLHKGMSCGNGGAQDCEIKVPARRKRKSKGDLDPFFNQSFARFAQFESIGNINTADLGFFAPEQTASGPATIAKTDHQNLFVLDFQHYRIFKVLNATTAQSTPKM